MNNVTEVKENQLVKVVNESGLEKTKAQVLLDNFSTYFEMASDWEKKANALTITDVSQKAEMKMAREGRLFLREKRIAIEKTRVKLKEESLREGKTIDAIATILKNLIVPIEEDLDNKEKFAERKAAEERDRLKQIRTEELTPFYEFVPVCLDLGSLDEANYQKVLSGAKLQMQAKIEAEKKAEEERIALIKAEEEERDRIKAENERLRAEAEAKEKALAEERSKREAELKEERERVEAERKAAEEKARIERERIEEIARKERDEAAAKLRSEQEAARIAKEKADAERKKIEETARIEREKAEAEQRKLRAELQAKAEAEAKAKREAEAKILAEKKAAEEAARKAANAPDKEKLLILAKNIGAISLPILSGKEAEKILCDVSTLLGKVVTFINEKADQL